MADLCPGLVGADEDDQGDQKEDCQRDGEGVRVRAETEDRGLDNEASSDLDNADVAFHRTLNALRTTLEPGRRSGAKGYAVTFSNDRYRLHPAVVQWSDLAAFDESMASAGAAIGPDEPITFLERARALYRGEYLDDCPFYGDSAEVEERRGLLRRRCIDMLLALGERYETRGDRPAAAASFRQARSLYGDDLPSADEALLRLGAPI